MYDLHVLWEQGLIWSKTSSRTLVSSIPVLSSAGRSYFPTWRLTCTLNSRQACVCTMDYLRETRPDPNSELLSVTISSGNPETATGYKKAMHTKLHSSWVGGAFGLLLVCWCGGDSSRGNWHLWGLPHSVPPLALMLPKPAHTRRVSKASWHSP